MQLLLNNGFVCVVFFLILEHNSYIRCLLATFPCALSSPNLTQIRSLKEVGFFPPFFSSLTPLCSLQLCVQLTPPLQNCSLFFFFNVCYCISLLTPPLLFLPAISLPYSNYDTGFLSFSLPSLPLLPTQAPPRAAWGEERQLQCVQW